MVYRLSHQQRRQLQPVYLRQQRYRQLLHHLLQHTRLRLCRCDDSHTWRLRLLLRLEMLRREHPRLPPCSPHPRLRVAHCRHLPALRAQCHLHALYLDFPRRQQQAQLERFVADPCRRHHRPLRGSLSSGFHIPLRWFGRHHAASRCRQYHDCPLSLHTS